MTKKRKRAKHPTLGEQIIAGLKEAIAFERGELRGVRVRTVAVTARHATAEEATSYSGKQIAKLRRQLKLSQPVFAAALNVSPETVRAWEQEKREPDGAALRLLEVVEEHPAWLLSKIRTRMAASV
jgi:putative transcriptional regulator